MANCKVEFIVKAPSQEVYLVGSVQALGNWDVTKAVKLTFNEETNTFTAAKMLPVGEFIEYKLLGGKDWSLAEKGIWNEELGNRSFTANKKEVVEVIVTSF